MSTKINVKIITNSRHDEICGLLGDVIKIKIKAKPVEGKANVYLIKFLSKKLSVKQSDISIISGKSSREKILKINNIEGKDLITKLGINQDEP